MKKNNAYYIDSMMKDLEFIINNTQNITQEELSQNEVLLDSMMFRLIQISEASQNLTEEYKAQRQEVPWHAIYGLRNRIVHDYGNVDISIVYSTLIDDIPDLYQRIKEEIS